MNLAPSLVEGVDYDEGGDGGGHGQVAEAAGKGAAEHLVHEAGEGEDGAPVEGVPQQRLQNLIQGTLSYLTGEKRTFRRLTFGASKDNRIECPAVESVLIFSLTLKNYFSWFELRNKIINNNLKIN